jgi:hypothetical protein
VSDETPPPELEELDRTLRSVRFEPRASFGPELLGRLRRGERSKGAVPSWRRRPAIAALAASVLLAAGAFLAIRHHPDVVVDRCCYDLDGGGENDDGVLVRAERDSRVHRLQLYEDRDRSRTFSPGDLIRLDRGADPAMQSGTSVGLVTREHCCLDFDGGGPDDDALLVIGVPPDRVVMAAIYERRAGGGDGFPLR